MSTSTPHDDLFESTPKASATNPSGRKEVSKGSCGHSHGNPLHQVQVLLPTGVNQAFDYTVPDGETVSLGSVVEVPFRSKTSLGVVWALEGNSDVPAHKIKPLKRILDCAPLPQVTLDFVEKVAAYNLAQKGMVLKMGMPVPSAFEPPEPEIFYTAPESVPETARLTPQRQRVLTTLKDAAPPPPPEQGLPKDALLRICNVSAAVVKGMVDIGLLTELKIVPGPKQVTPLPPPAVSFTKDQQAAISMLQQQTPARNYNCILLDGVTGAGKTDVYFELLAKTIEDGGQALVLLPEIALSTSWLKRFQNRFGFEPTVWHSDLTPAQRRDALRTVRLGHAPVVVGARSALFLPFPDLRLMVVDEEHDHSFKQEEAPLYQGRDMAVMRAHLGQIPIILASATPSLETMNNVWQGKYQVVTLPKRATGAAEPTIELVDLKHHKLQAGQWISAPLAQAVADTLATQRQSLIYMNRRGYAPTSVCRSCGYQVVCSNCTATMVRHQRLSKMMCHQCGYTQPVPPECPNCGDKEGLTLVGPGVERLQEEVKALFPNARTLIMSSDTLTTPKIMDNMLTRIRDHRVDIIIGTQIIGKGHHFPKLNLIGVIDADLGLNGSDIRATERTYQILHQVAGRAGREAGEHGHVLLQTHHPEMPVMQALAAYDRDAFLEAERAQREAAGYPPFGKLAGIVVSGTRENEVIAAAKQVARTAPQSDTPKDFQVFGPAPAPFARLRGRHRYRLLVKAAKPLNIQHVMREWIGRVSAPSTVRISVDIDPYTFF